MRENLLVHAKISTNKVGQNGWGNGMLENVGDPSKNYVKGAQFLSR